MKNKVILVQLLKRSRRIMGIEKLFVCVCKGRNAYSVTREVLGNLNFDIQKLEGKQILIKPNSGRLVDPCLGINTNPDVVAGVMDFFLEAGIKDIAVGESPILGVKALSALKKCGISDIAKKRGVPLLDLDSTGYVSVKIPDGKVIKHLKICRKALASDFIVSIPVMKTHMHTQVSLGLKNMKGCLYKREKVRLHQLPFSEKINPPATPLDMAIADMSKVLLPDLTVIDGTIGQEGLGPGAGQAKKVGIVLASLDCLAVDWVATELMGFDPENVQHLKLAIDELKVRNKKFDIQRKTLEVEPEDYKKWRVFFNPPPKKISLEFSNVIIEDKDSCSACLSTILMFLKRYYHEYADYFSKENPLRIALGKGIKKQAENTLLIGNCTFKQKKNGIYIKGCPPVASQIRKELNKIL